MTLTVLIVELGFHIFYPIPFWREDNLYFESDSFTGYKLKPNSVGHFLQGIPARVNKNGHRDKLDSVEKIDGVLRILVLGDSFTLGLNVPEDDTYTEILETLFIRNELPVEVINAGVDGWQPFQYAQYYEHYGWKFSPDLILIGFFVGNDTYDQRTEVHQYPTAILGRQITEEAALNPLINIKVILYNHSHIARLILKKGPRVSDFTRRHCSDFRKWHLKIQRRRLRNHFKRSKALKKRARNSIYQIQRIKKLAERASIPMGVVLIPDENQINRNLQQLLLKNQDRSKFDFEMPQSMLRDMFTDAGIPVIDLQPYFKEDSRCLYMNDTHWTAEGHALAAAVIFEKITNGNIWPNLAIEVGQPR